MESETNRNRVTNNPGVIADGSAGPSIRQDDGPGSIPTPPHHFARLANSQLGWLPTSSEGGSVHTRVNSQNPSLLQFSLLAGRRLSTVLERYRLR